MFSPCLIPSKPDVAGLGVRIAIYAQNLLCFVPAVWAIWDAEVTDYEQESVKTQSTTNFALAFSILISCVVQAFTLGLTNHHASIVLSMSWINNTNVFIHLLLYVHYKAKEGLGRTPVKPQWSAWLSHLKTQCRAIPDGWASARENDPRTGDAGEMRNTQRTNGSITKILPRRIALSLGSLHLTLMAAPGLWLWSDPQSFGRSNSTCTTEFASPAILGNRVPFGSNPLHIFSLGIYAIFLLPGFNLLLPIVAFLGLFIWHHARYRQGTPPAPAKVDSPRLPSQSPPTLRRRSTVFPIWLQEAYAKCMYSSVFPVWIGLIFLLAINIFFIADIELTLRRNRDLLAPGKKKWGFDKDVKKSRYRREAVLPGDVKAGADPNIRASDGRTALQIAALAGTQDNVRAMLESKADINAKDSGASPLPSSLTVRESNARAQMAAQHLKRYVRLETGPVPTLVEANAEVNAKLSDDRTALEVLLGL